MRTHKAPRLPVLGQRPVDRIDSYLRVEPPFSDARGQRAGRQTEQQALGMREVPITPKKRQHALNRIHQGLLDVHQGRPLRAGFLVLGIPFGRRVDGCRFRSGTIFPVALSRFHERLLLLAFG
jgi:hypothetical protein